MKKVAALLIALSFFAFDSEAQFYIEPLIGYQVDLNNNNRFKLINSALQASYKINKFYEVMLQVQKTWAIPFRSSDSAFSADPAFPLYARAAKIIRPSSFSIAIGQRISIIKADPSNIFSIVFYSGVNFQKIAVSYQYDKTNYTILNPDKTLYREGFFVSGGVEYMRLLKNGRLLVQFIVATPPARKKIDYPASFDFMAPLSFNAGYSIALKKNHEKD